MQYSLSFAALSSAVLAASAITTAPPSYDPCIGVFESCVQSGMTVAGGPNFAYCGAQSEACSKTAFPTSTTSAASSTTTDRCYSVYEGCVQSGISEPLGPNFAYCGAQSQACLKTAYASSTSMSAPPAYTTTSSKQFTTLIPPTTRTFPSTTRDSCYSVYESCVQSGISQPLGPNFAYCGAQSEACLRTVSKTAAATPPVYTTKVVTKYTTYCPTSTVITVNPSNTITVTSATTLTITDCPCTITSPVSPKIPVPVPFTAVSAGSSVYAPGPSITSSAGAPAASQSSPGPATYTGAAAAVKYVDMAAAAAAAAAAFLV